MNEHQIRTLTKNIISQIRLNKIIWRQALKTHEKAIVKLSEDPKPKNFDWWLVKSHEIYDIEVMVSDN